MVFFPVFAKLHPRRFVSPPPRDLRERSVEVYPERSRRALDCSFSFVFSNSQLQLPTSASHPLSPFLSHSCALFYAGESANSFLFRGLHTLWRKPPGGGECISRNP